MSINAQSFVHVERLLHEGSRHIAAAERLEAAGATDEAMKKYNEGLQKWTKAVNSSNNTKNKATFGLASNFMEEKIKEIKQRIRPFESSSETFTAFPARQSTTVEAEEETNTSVFHKDYDRVTWDEIGGLQEAIQSLQEAIKFPRMSPELFKGLNKPNRVLLLYGPPGTGKTRLVQAVATELDGWFANVSSADIMSKYQSESEKTIRAIFKGAVKMQPCILFFDEVDAIASQRGDESNMSERAVKNELLLWLQKILDGDWNITVLMATNMPQSLDAALRRRLEKRIYVGLPDVEARQAMIHIALRKAKDHALSEKDVFDIARKTEGYSGSDMLGLMKEAAKMNNRASITSSHYYQKDSSKDEWYPCSASASGAQALTYASIASKVRLEPLNKTHIEQALLCCKPTCSAEEVAAYETWNQQFGSEG